MRADRLLLLVSLLRHRGRLTAAQLAAELEVDPRTVLRDIEALSTAGIPVYAERGRHGGFGLLPGFTPDATELTPQEAAALFAAGGDQALRRLGMDAPLASALRKLGATLPDSVSSAVTRTGERLVVDPEGWSGLPDDLPQLAAVQQATFTDRRLRFHYTPKDHDRAGERTVDPYGLLLAGSFWYLIAAHRGQPRSYRVSRMSEVKVLDTPSSRPPDLDLRAMWQRMRTAYATADGPLVTVRVSRRWAELLGQSIAGQLIDPPSVSPDGENVIITGRARVLRGVAAALAGFSEMVDVLGPPALRAQLAQIGTELVARYGDPNNGRDREP